MEECFLAWLCMAQCSGKRRLTHAKAPVVRLDDQHGNVAAIEVAMHLLFADNRAEAVVAVVCQPAQLGPVVQEESASRQEDPLTSCQGSRLTA